MGKAEVIRLKEGERIDVVKHSVRDSIVGPALVVVVKEAAAAEEATTSRYNLQNHRC